MTSAPSLTKRCATARVPLQHSTRMRQGQSTTTSFRGFLASVYRASLPLRRLTQRHLTTVMKVPAPAPVRSILARTSPRAVVYLRSIFLRPRRTRRTVGLDRSHHNRHSSRRSRTTICTTTRRRTSGTFSTRAFLGRTTTGVLPCKFVDRSAHSSHTERLIIVSKPSLG